uniref:Uncharacterized protein n=1 Tax=Solanum demissum TaxID=50514 RepID=Q0KIV3_SOLDE|nr:hypothetical protein SDM1_22t00011 [Solanum demissum]
MATTATGRPPFEAIYPAPPPQTTTYATLFNSITINPKQSALINSKTIVKSIEIIHGEPTITFSMEERQDFMIEEGLHQAVVFKLSHGAPDLKVLSWKAMKIDPPECKEARRLTLNCSLDQRCTGMPILVTCACIIRRCRPTDISTLSVRVYELEC